ncbi:MAG: hypothetical protein EOP84_21220 [Verrucomicrobiaceae bacterium]|nr:MAG: hypothetical protein EOP84_21220 [Verrucomicrobiaceae bacterium]
MRRLLHAAFFVWAAVAFFATQGIAIAGQLTVQVEHRWRGEPLRLGELRLRNDSGNLVSITRLSYLLSKAKLQRADGSWIGADNWFAFLDPATERTTAVSSSRKASW